MDSVDRGPQTLVHWIFKQTVTADGESWTWERRNARNKATARSVRLPNLGKAITEAITHGFMPARHHWIIKSPVGEQHYPYGRQPRIDPDPPLAPSPPKPARRRGRNDA